MKIYIATPVNGRKEKSKILKLYMAAERVYILKDKLKERYPKAKMCSFLNLDEINPANILKMKESEIMGKCVQMVMECDTIFMDDGWMFSNGCRVENNVANIYGKVIITKKDLEL